jgi:tRNA(Met) cytidine acetyltransferase
VLGVICTISEGGDHIFSDGVDRVDEASELPNLIATGKRRIQGHMSVQALAQHLNMPEILSHRVHRIHRIAVHPDLQRQSHGSDMLKALEARKQSLGIAAFTTAFGLTDPLHQFWQLNHYCLIKIGQRKDTSSAMVTGHYVQRDSPLYRQICDSASEHLQIDLRYLKKYQQSLYAVIPKRIISLASSDSDDGTGECLACERKLKLFATEVISYAMAKSALYSMALKHQSSELTCLINRLHIKHLSKEQKEQITLLLRDGVKTLMDQCNKN